MNFYTADWHINHANVIKYSNRPFVKPDGTPDVEMMRRTILERINERVGRTDTLYVLGDVAFAGLDPTVEFLEAINCENMHLIWGNHDPDKLRAHPIWKSSTPLKEIKDQGKHVVLCHYAMRVWNRAHHGALQLFGHSHAGMPGNSQSLDVGVDAWDFYPVALPEIIGRMVTLPEFTPEDHHR